MKSILKTLQFLLISVICLVASSQAFAADKITFYHYDLLGSPVATTNELGEVVWREEYSPYGDKLLKQDAALDKGKDDNVRGYTGHVFDEETGLTYMQARYYDPQIGRFMGVDPVGFVEDNPISFNRYAYANNNPYKYVDPNGEVANPISAAFTGLGILALGTIAYGNMSPKEQQVTREVLGQIMDSFGNSIKGMFNEETDDDPDSVDNSDTQNPNAHTPDVEALNDLVNDVTNHGTKPLSPEDTETIIGWAGELGLDVRDDRENKNWKPRGVPTSHIHIENIKTKRAGGHIPAEPKVSNDQDTSGELNNEN